MAEILPIRPKTPSNQSINQSNAEIRDYDFFKFVKTDSKISYNGFY